MAFRTRFEGTNLTGTILRRADLDKRVDKAAGRPVELEDRVILTRRDETVAIRTE